MQSTSTEYSLNGATAFESADFWDQTSDKTSPRLPAKALKLLVFGATLSEERLVRRKFHAFEVLFVKESTLDAIFNWCSFHPAAKVLVKFPGENNLAAYISYFTATKMRFATYQNPADLAQLPIIETFF